MQIQFFLDGLRVRIKPNEFSTELSESKKMEAAFAPSILNRAVELCSGGLHRELKAEIIGNSAHIV